MFLAQQAVCIFNLYTIFSISDTVLDLPLESHDTEPGVSIADEDGNDTIVDDNILAEVKLAKTSREFATSHNFLFQRL